MTLLLEPTIVRASGKPPPEEFYADVPEAPEPEAEEPEAPA
jgi:hypothetical protein